MLLFILEVIWSLNVIFCYSLGYVEVLLRGFFSIRRKEFFSDLILVRESVFEGIYVWRDSVIESIWFILSRR